MFVFAHKISQVSEVLSTRLSIRRGVTRYEQVWSGPKCAPLLDHCGDSRLSTILSLILVDIVGLRVSLEHMVLLHRRQVLIHSHKSSSSPADVAFRTSGSHLRRVSKMIYTYWSHVLHLSNTVYTYRMMTWQSVRQPFVRSFESSFESSVEGEVL